jgi:tight adherence protein C
MGLTGGLTVQDSLGHVSRELHGSHPDLATEFEIVRRHSELSGLGSAFQQFATRVDCPETVTLAAIVNQSERLGSNINTAIREYADGVRTKLRQSADERASKAGIKLLFPLVLCLAPAAMIILWGPAALELRNFFRGFTAVENQQVTRSSQ